MKATTNILLLAISLFLLSCKSEQQSTPSVANQTNGELRGTWTGTFEIQVTSPEPYVKTGTITMTFADSAYTYTGETTSPPTSRYRLNERGKYTLLPRTVKMEDEYLLRSAITGPSLFLGGVFQYQIQHDNLVMRQTLATMSSVLTLFKR